MANCIKCSRDVGCSCNLVDGFCLSCYSVNINETGITPTHKKSKRVVYNNTVKNGGEPNTEFEVILKTPGLTKEEKLKKINDILTKAIQKAKEDVSS